MVNQRMMGYGVNREGISKVFCSPCSPCLRGESDCGLEFTTESQRTRRKTQNGTVLLLLRGIAQIVANPYYLSVERSPRPSNRHQSVSQIQEHGERNQCALT